jgi:4-hydroxy-tetrahydrodipicolinate reductase
MKIGVCGVGGRMGREVCKAVLKENDLELVCAVDPSYAGKGLAEVIPGLEMSMEIAGSIEALAGSGAEAMVDFTVAEAARENVPYALENGIHCVVGTTGFGDRDLKRFDQLALSNGVGCIIAPNFAVGAVLMMYFARKAAQLMQACEIVEMHHPAKLDAPSGTARNTARIILEAQGREEGEEKDEGPRGLDLGGIHIHSVRLPGLVAHQEVIFGEQGQTLTIRHDSLDRTSFMPGVIKSLRKVSETKGLVVGLEEILGL